MNCTKPIRLFKNLNPSEFPDGLLVPCGKCLQCRIQKRKEWTARLIHEQDSWNDSVFVTFTYNDDNVPENKTLVKQDLQKLFKRLRKAIAPRKIKYYACGEYGEPSRDICIYGKRYRTEGERPHYHAIIFGISIKEKEVLENVWKIGFVHCGLVEPDSIRYVAQYVDKKYSGDKAIEEYEKKGRAPVFRLTSLGLGEEFIKKNKEQLIKNEGFTLFGVPNAFPRYYLKKLGLEKSDFRKNMSIEKDIKFVEKITGITCTDDELYKNSSADDYMKYYEEKRDRIQQKSDTVQAKLNLKQKKL